MGVSLADSVSLNMCVCVYSVHMKVCKVGIRLTAVIHVCHCSALPSFLFVSSAVLLTLSLQLSVVCVKALWCVAAA